MFRNLFVAIFAFVVSVSQVSAQPPKVHDVLDRQAARSTAELNDALDELVQAERVFRPYKQEIDRAQWIVKDTADVVLQLKERKSGLQGVSSVQTELTAANTALSNAPAPDEALTEAVEDALARLKVAQLAREAAISHLRLNNSAFVNLVDNEGNSVDDALDILLGRAGREWSRALKALEAAQAKGNARQRALTAAQNKVDELSAKLAPVVTAGGLAGVREELRNVGTKVETGFSNSTGAINGLGSKLDSVVAATDRLTAAVTKLETNVATLAAAEGQIGLQMKTLVDKGLSLKFSDQAFAEKFSTTLGNLDKWAAGEIEKGQQADPKFQEKLLDLLTRAVTAAETKSVTSTVTINNPPAQPAAAPAQSAPAQYYPPQQYYQCQPQQCSPNNRYYRN